MSCAFFCDTGVIYGWCYPPDDHKPACKYFFKKYPLSKNDYYVPQVVINEINNHKIKLIRNSKHMNKKMRAYARTFEQCTDTLLNKMDKFDANAYESFVDTFEDLKKELEIIIPPDAPNKENDIEIVAHAIIWNIIGAQNHTLITVDGRDLASKETEIVEQACETSNETVSLKIIYIPSLICSE